MTVTRGSMHNSSPLAALNRAAASVLSPGHGWGRLSILIYHRVLPKPDPLWPDAIDVATFDAQLAALSQCFTVIPLHEALSRLQAGTLPARAACITFDDGYADNLHQALPILQRHGLHATFFIASDYLDGGRMFNDTVIETLRQAAPGCYDLTDMGLSRYELNGVPSRLAAIGEILSRVKYLGRLREREVTKLIDRFRVGHLPRNLMLTSEQLRAMHRVGMEIGGHTASHPMLAQLAEAEAEAEIQRGRARLEQLLNAEVRLFAYPNGRPGIDYVYRDVELVRKLDFMGAVSTAWGTSTRRTDPYQLPRFQPWAQHPPGFIFQLLHNLLRHRPDPALM